ncbi:MAG: hypothetical protein J5833_09375 [Victivallales bacterium]|nr:hypothetical protein [Victivallales bacterium]
MFRLSRIPETWDGTRLTSDDFVVVVNGQPCQVRNCRVSAMNFNRVWEGVQRPLEQTELASYVSLECDGETEFRVRPSRQFSHAVIRPLSRTIATTQNDGWLSFTLPGPGFYVLELDDNHRALHIFCNAYDDFPEKETATYCFGPGIHETGILELKDGESVYIDRDAILFGALRGSEVQNVRIFGHGVIDSRKLERLTRDTDWIGHLTNGNIRFIKSQNVQISGVILMDSPIWSASFFDCQNVSVKNVKIVGQWRYNSDGIDICNCQDCKVEDSFIRAFDDVAVVKGMQEYYQRPIRNISFERCVLWCDWGRTCEVGIETWAPEIKGIRYADCDLIHNSDTALDIQAGGTGFVQDVVFENIRVEFQPYNTNEVYQTLDETKFTPRHGGLGLIRVQNHKYIVFSQPYGRVDGIVFRNVKVYLEEGAPRPKAFIKAFGPSDRPFGRMPWGELDKGKPEPFGSILLENVSINDETIHDISELPGYRNEPALANLRVTETGGR